jgi:hypothetical protein
MASRVENLMALILPVFKFDRFTLEIPIVSVILPDDIILPDFCSNWAEGSVVICFCSITRNNQVFSNFLPLYHSH